MRERRPDHVRPRRDIARGAAPRRRPASRVPGGVLHAPQRRRRRSPLPLLLAILAAAVALGLYLRPSLAPSAPKVTPAGQRSVPSDPPRHASTPDVVSSDPGDGIKIATFLGGSSRRSYGLAPAPKKLRLIWKRKIGSGRTRRKVDDRQVWWAGSGWTGQCTVVRQKGRDYLLLGGYDHDLHRIDARTGKVVWEYSFDDVIKGTNTVIEDPDPENEDDRLIVVAGSRRGSDYAVGDKRIMPLRAVSFATGKELWRLPVPKTANYSQDVDSSPLLVDGVLYAAVESGYVYAIDPFRTRRVGSHYEPLVLRRSPRLFTAEDAAAHPDLGQANVALEASPSRIGDTLYVASGSGHVYGLKLPTLEIVWDFHTGSDIDGTTVVGSDGRILQSIEKEYVSRPGGVFGLDPKQAPASAPLWYFPTADRGLGEWKGGVVGSVATNDEGNPGGTHPRLAAFMSVDGTLRVIAPDRLTSERVKGPGARAATPVPHEVFRDSVGGSISTPIIVGDKIIAAGYDRKVHLYRIRYTRATASDDGVIGSPDGGQWKVRVDEIASFKAGGPFESTPIVWNGKVFIGCRDGYLYCLGDH